MPERPALPESVLHPRHPERTCWGCDLYCPANDLRCGNGTIRTPHPIELFGDDIEPDVRSSDIISGDDVAAGPRGDRADTALQVCRTR